MFRRRQIATSSSVATLQQVIESSQLMERVPMDDDEVGPSHHKNTSFPKQCRSWMSQCQRARCFLLFLIGASACEMFRKSRMPSSSGVMASVDEFGTSHLIPLLIRTRADSVEHTSAPDLPPITYASDLERQRAELPDYAFLNLRDSPQSQDTAANGEFGRTIFKMDDLRYNLVRRKQLKRMDQESEDEDNYYTDELEYSACQRPSWRDMYYPVCNNFHEIDLERSVDDAVPNFDSQFFGHGHFRDVWMVSNNQTGPPLVLKTARARHDLDLDFLAMIRKDGLIMTAMLDSPRIVNILGACSGSLTVEPIETNMLDIWIPRYRATKYQDMNLIPGLDVKGDVRSENNLTITEKMDTSVEIAEAIADLNGYNGGVIVHDDLMPDQWLRRRDGQLVLSDFNRAFVLDWNVEENEYCRIRHGRRGNYYDAPEIDEGIPNDEKINTYQFGGHIYALITGLRVYPELQLESARKRAQKGDLSYLDIAFRNGTYVERELVKVMEKCWTHNRDERPDIFEVLNMLRDIQAIHRQNMANNGS